MRPDAELTILLTVKDRLPFSYRWLSYADAIRFPFAVCVAGGGTSDEIGRTLTDQSRFPHARYEYVRSAKMEDVLSGIRTPFVAMADTDTFFVVDGLRKAVDFLSRHADYATCGGRHAAFVIDAPPGTTEALYGPAWWRLSRRDAPPDCDTARDRLRNLMPGAPGMSHHVRRTEALRAQFQMLRDWEADHLFLQDVLIAFLTTVAGKSKVLDAPYVAQQWNAPWNSARTPLLPVADHVACMLAPTWSADFERLVTITARALAERDGIPHREARRIVIEAYRRTMAPVILRDALTAPTVTLPMAIAAGLARRLLALPPGSLTRRLARTLYRTTRWIPIDMVRGTALAGRPVPNAGRELAHIAQFLTR